MVERVLSFKNRLLGMQIVLDVYGIITNNIRLSQNWLTLFISFQMRVTSFNDVLIMNKDETPVVVYKKNY